MNRFLVLLFSLLFISGCSVKTVKEFYMLSYHVSMDKPDNNKTKRKYPLPYRLEIADFDINRVYDRSAIVVRQSLHKMIFDEKQLWAYRPHKAATELLITHINSAGLFAECRNEFMDASADYFITGRINNIEKYENNLFSFAYLDIDLTFTDKDKNVLLTKKIRKDIKLEGASTAFFVKNISDVLKEEYDGFIKEIFNLMDSRQQ